MIKRNIGNSNSPDFPIFYSKELNKYGIKIFDGGQSYLNINFCPWCGKEIVSNVENIVYYYMEQFQSGYDLFEIENVISILNDLTSEQYNTVAKDALHWKYIMKRFNLEELEVNELPKEFRSLEWKIKFENEISEADEWYYLLNIFKLQNENENFTEIDFRKYRDNKKYLENMRLYYFLIEKLNLKYKELKEYPREFKNGEWIDKYKEFSDLAEKYFMI